MSRFGSIVRVGIYVGTGLASGLWILAATKDPTRLFSFLGGGLSTLVLALIVVAVVDLNGSRLLRGVSKLRPHHSVFETDRVDGNESDARALGLTGPGLPRRFVVVLGEDEFEVWTTEGVDQPALVVPWSKLRDVTIVTLPLSTALMRPSVDAVHLHFAVDAETIGLDLVPHGAVQWSKRNKSLANLADAIASRANAATAR